MDSTFALVILIIAIALVFDFINGFHDAANSVATVVATQVLSPAQAVIWAAFFNFVAAFSALALGTGVAKTVGAGMVNLKLVTPYVILAGLLGAITWDLITWWLGLPTSSSHALLGGYAGAAYAAAGFKAQCGQLKRARRQLAYARRRLGEHPLLGDLERFVESRGGELAEP